MTAAREMGPCYENIAFLPQGPSLPVTAEYLPPSAETSTQEVVSKRAREDEATGDEGRGGRVAVACQGRVMTDKEKAKTLPEPFRVRVHQ